MSRRIVQVVFVLLVVAVYAFGVSPMFAGKPGGGGGGGTCPEPRAGCVCPMIYDPVVCAGGCTKYTLPWRSCVSQMVLC